MTLRSLIYSTIFILLIASLSIECLPFVIKANNPRILYAVTQMPLAGILIAIEALTIGVFYRVGLFAKVLSGKKDLPFILLIIFLFITVWAPVSFISDFAQDDWSLLAAAAERPMLISSPMSAWYALDTVGGNFRPLTTGILFSGYFQLFGTWPLGFLLINFCINIAGVLMIYAVARQLAFSGQIGLTAAALYMTRGLLYTLIGWPCAIGDGLVILLQAIIFYLIVSAERTPRARIGLHLAAWCLFCVALLAKQSAYTIPFLTFLTLLLAPQRGETLDLRRLKPAIAGLAAYLIPVLVVFLHAKSLMNGETPFPLELNPSTILHLFSYVTWLIFMIDLSSRNWFIENLPWLAGLTVCCVAMFALLRARPWNLERPFTLLFLCLAAIASLSLFAILPTRAAGYYGATAAFWGSLALASVLVPMTSNSQPARSRGIALAVIVGLLASGYLDIRVKQTGLIPSGGYIWGTYSGWRDRGTYNSVGRALTDNHSPLPNIIVFAGKSYSVSTQAAMALLHPHNQDSRIFGYTSTPATWWSNNREGREPGHFIADLSDLGAYQWKTEISAERVRALSGTEATTWLFAKGDHQFCAVQTHAPLAGVPRPCN